jgi:hypothetical protein
VNPQQPASVVPFPRKPTPAEEQRRRALVRFKDALVAFSDDQTADNAVRYLAASRALEDIRRAGLQPVRSDRLDGLPPAA